MTLDTVGCLVSILGALCLATVAVASAAEEPPADIAAEAADRAPWKALWDGKTTGGWHEIGKGRWTIEDGAIVGRHEKGEAEFSHLVTDRTFKDFTVRLKYKTVRGNSGLYFRIEEKGFSGVSGFQAEIDPANDVGGLYETNGRAWVVKPTPDQVKTWFKPGEWNEMTVTAIGRNVTVHVNGKRSATLIDDPGRTEGRIALQMHGGQDGEVWFKDIAVLEWTDLLPGPAMAGWRQPTGEWAMVGDAIQDPGNEKAVAVKEGKGTIYNGPKGRTDNLFSDAEHGDVAAHIEFMIPKGSNSGVYFQGRYEIQVYDSFGVEKGEYPGIECGGIYERWDPSRGKGKEGFEGRSPRTNAGFPPGRWQSFDVVFQAPRFDDTGRKVANARFVKVVHNGVVIHENVELTGPTRAAAFEDEKPLGPLMLQGDHGPVAYRNIRILPLGK
jgi:hypothetical protein